jgi:N-acetylmannosamine-6-phosphate 2-epimerase/N-acetylmannosamine kinase
MLERLHGGLVVSCQPVVGGPMDNPHFVVGFALAAKDAGAAGLRIEGLANLRAVRAACSLPVIGLIKRPIPDSPVFITPDVDDVWALVDAGADIIAFDATLRPRPVAIDALVRTAHEGGCLAMADIATIDDARAAAKTGADVIGTTLSGYTGGPVPQHPDLELVTQCRTLGLPVFAEGRYHRPDQARQAMEAGATAVVVGSAITRPEHIAEWFVSAIRSAQA